MNTYKHQLNENIPTILDNSRTIAVVGLSKKDNRPSHDVARYLKNQGFRIIPVNPKYDSILDEVCYKSLRDIEEPVDVVDIFRRPEEVSAVVDDAIAIGAKAIWMQSGIVNEEAAKNALEAGLLVVMDACMKVEHLLHSGINK